jgi:FSR family fosmidomycin resistance protein-like MFS transporter
MIGDWIGRYAIIWLSILALPYVDLFWTGVLTVAINVLMGSTFAAIIIYAMELMPIESDLSEDCSTVSIAMGGIAAAIIGGLSDHIRIEAAYKVCSFLPLAGLQTALLPPYWPPQATPRRGAKATAYSVRAGAQA